MAKTETIWILIADDAHAKIYVNHGRGTDLTKAPDHEFAASRAPIHERVSDRQGRTFDRAS